MSKTLAIGMTVGLRRNKGVIYDYCDRSVVSLRRAGFTEPLHAFVEPQAEMHVPSRPEWQVRLHMNKRNLGCFKNFRMGLKWLLDHTQADWLLMLQDDAIWTPGASALVYEAINDPRFQQAGFLSPYTSKAMVDPKQRKFAQAGKLEDPWQPARFHNKAFWGAVAMLFPRASALKLETECKRYREHKHHRKLDVVVGNAMRRDMDLAIYVRVPSLCNHIGAFSTLGRHRFKGNQWGRRGFLFQK